ncbi:MAG: helix-turn-helix transcriptional regulator [Streptosporangiales bacterium]|nr:helix-turn-helix transcriptional regulator [Streptosporangiales bacterium]
MRLKSGAVLRALVGPEPGKKMPARRLAEYVGCHPSFIDHLLAERRRACTDKVAERIAEVLGVPVEILFVPGKPSTGTSRTKRRRAAA